MVATYRSYVIRVRRPSDEAHALQLDVEDLIDGGHASLRGLEAHGLAESLRALIRSGADSPTPVSSAPVGVDARRRKAP